MRFGIKVLAGTGVCADVRSKRNFSYLELFVKTYALDAVRSHTLTASPAGR
jgi:hypothetical protein